MRVLAPAGVLVLIECEHLCMAMRGIAKAGSTTVTRAEAMSLMLRHP